MRAWTNKSMFFSFYRSTSHGGGQGSRFQSTHFMFYSRLIYQALNPSQNSSQFYQPDVTISAQKMWRIVNLPSEI